MRRRTKSSELRRYRWFTDVYAQAAINKTQVCWRANERITGKTIPTLVLNYLLRIPLARTRRFVTKISPLRPTREENKQRTQPSPITTYARVIFGEVCERIDGLVERRVERNKGEHGFRPAARG